VKLSDDWEVSNERPHSFFKNLQGWTVFVSFFYCGASCATPPCRQKNLLQDTIRTDCHVPTDDGISNTILFSPDTKSIPCSAQ